MKKYLSWYALICILLCLLLFPSCNTRSSAKQQSYIQAYTDFLLNTSIDAGHDFPIHGYYLFDLNFDDIPELGVFHDSGGSMGGYFTYYCFDGKKVMPVLDNMGSHARTSNYTQILSDTKNRKVYFLKEMYLLKGNINGTYGYLRELRDKNGIPYVSDILNLEVDQNADPEVHYHKNYYCEDDYLSDFELDTCLITEQYYEGKWKKISSAKYLEIKRKMIPENHTFADLRDTGVSVLLYDTIDEIMNGSGQYDEISITDKEVEMLFDKWLTYIKSEGGNHFHR